MHADSKENLIARYDREAEAYRDLWGPVLRVAGRGLLREFRGEQVARVLDVGTGVGSMVPDLQEMFPAALILGVDRSPGMLALAPRDIPRAVMDGSQLALRSASMDLVLMLFMLFHLDSPVDGLREARRVVRPGGRVGSVTWERELQSPTISIWTECLDAHGAAKADPSIETRHSLVDAPEKMETQLRNAGFTTVRSWTGELRVTLDPDLLIRMRTSLGASKPRFDSLAPAARQSCVETARHRMAGLSPGEFVAEGRVVYAVASAS